MLTINSHSLTFWSPSSNQKGILIIWLAWSLFFTFIFKYMWIFIEKIQWNSKSKGCFLEGKFRSNENRLKQNDYSVIFACNSSIKFAVIFTLINRYLLPYGEFIFSACVSLVIHFRLNQILKFDIRVFHSKLLNFFKLFFT